MKIRKSYYKYVESKDIIPRSIPHSIENIYELDGGWSTFPEWLADRKSESEDVHTNLPKFVSKRSRSTLYGRGTVGVEVHFTYITTPLKSYYTCMSDE